MKNQGKSSMGQNQPRLESNQGGRLTLLNLKMFYHIKTLSQGLMEESTESGNTLIHILMIYDKNGTKNSNERTVFQ